MKVPKPKNEVRRLEVLWHYDILDTAPETVFDELTNLAALICNAPIALITLIDEDRQWFKASVGTTLKQTSRDISFCAHAILHHELLIVPDASKDPRFKSNPLVIAKPKIRFYAGAPLVTSRGLALGTLCVFDQVPRQLSQSQKNALAILARHVMTQLELRRKNRELTTQRKSSAGANSKLKNARSKIAQLQKKLLAIHKK
jgi:GAF domain-containing protein